MLAAKLVRELLRILEQASSKRLAQTGARLPDIGQATERTAPTLSDGAARPAAANAFKGEKLL